MPRPWGRKELAEYVEARFGEMSLETGPDCAGTCRLGFILMGPWMTLSRSTA